MLGGHMDQQLIAVERLGQDAGRTGFDAAPAAGTLLGFQFEDAFFHAHRITIDDPSATQSPQDQPGLAVGAAFRRRDPLDPRGPRGSDGSATVAGMSRPSAAAQRLPLRQGVGLDEDLGGRRRGSERCFFGGPLLIPQLAAQRHDLLLELIDTPLLFQAAGAKTIMAERRHRIIFSGRRPAWQSRRGPRWSSVALPRGRWRWPDAPGAPTRTARTRSAAGRPPGS